MTDFLFYLILRFLGGGWGGGCGGICDVTNMFMIELSCLLTFTGERRGHLLHRMNSIPYKGYVY